MYIQEIDRNYSYIKRKKRENRGKIILKYYVQSSDEEKPRLESAKYFNFMSFFTNIFRESPPEIWEEFSDCIRYGTLFQ